MIPLLNLANQSYLMPANKCGRGSNTRCTQPFIYRRPCNQSASLSIPTQIQPAPSTWHHSAHPPTIHTPIPTPVLQPFIPPQIQSNSSSRTLKLTRQIHQPFLLEGLYLGPEIPTCNSAELQAFINHCRFILGGHSNQIINHSITDLYEITPAPAVFARYLWRYRIVINIDRILEDYPIIARTTSLPIHTALQHTFTVYYNWNAIGYTDSLDE